jgi:hypothetical protein
MAEKSENNFLKTLMIISLAAIVISIFPLVSYSSSKQALSLIIGFVISLANAVAGYVIIERAFNKNIKIFMTMIFGSMAARMMAIAIIMLLIVFLTKLDFIYLVASLMFFYFLFTGIEIYYLQKKNRKNDNIKYNTAAANTR